MKYQGKTITGWRKAGVFVVGGLAALVGSANLAGCENPSHINQTYIHKIEQDNRIPENIKQGYTNLSSLTKEQQKSYFAHYEKNKKEILDRLKKDKSKYFWLDLDNPDNLNNADKALFGGIDYEVGKLISDNIDSLSDLFSGRNDISP